MAPARKRIRTKGKAQPTATSTGDKATAPAPSSVQNDSHVQVKQTSISHVSQNASQAQTAVTAQQSSDVVQTFLFSATSTILWMRDLLPDEYFRTAFYASINKHCSYHDFTRETDGAGVAPGDRSRPKGYHLRVLKRSVSTRGDQIIKWLETGVFEAIERGYLDQLQICIFADEGRPTNVIELYCFHLHYSELSQDGSIVVDVEVQDAQTKKTVSLKNTREALNTVIKNMVGLNGTMPHLPELCFMSPYLVWNERRPLGYQPPGFHSSNDVNISFPVTEGWMMETSTCGQVKTGHRMVDLGIAYTKGVELTLGNDGEAIVMPDFAYGGELSRLESFTNQGGNRQHQDETPGSNIQELPTPRLSSVTAHGMDFSRSTSQKHDLSTRLTDNEIPTSRHGTIDDGADTQDREDLARLKALRPIEPHQMHDTQLVPRPPATPSQLDPSTVTARNLQGKRHDYDHPRATTTQGSRISESMTISCECGTKETENMIKCSGCNGWQHAQCYAYNGSDDISMPAERMCYTCLLSNASSDHLDKAKELTRTRQVIHCIRARGLTSPTQISKTLGYTRSDLAKLLERLKQDNIVHLEKPRRKSEHVALISTETAKRALTDFYLDPSKSIKTLVADGAAGRTIQSTPRKRKDHGSPELGLQPKTPRLSRPYSTLVFDSNHPFTPASESFASQGVD